MIGEVLLMLFVYGYALDWSTLGGIGLFDEVTLEWDNVPGHAVSWRVTGLEKLAFCDVRWYIRANVGRAACCGDCGQIKGSRFSMVCQAPNTLTHVISTKYLRAVYDRSLCETRLGLAIRTWRRFIQLNALDHKWFLIRHILQYLNRGWTA
jgi:hypothetical protein